MGRVTAELQNTTILGLFGDKVAVARRRYLEFVKKGIAAGQRQDLTGGGLVRSVGGWSAVKSLRKAGVFQKGDERILGDGEFVEKVLSQAEEAFERKYRLKARGIDVGRIAERVADIMGMAPEAVWASGKQPKIVQARSLLCYWATSELDIRQAWLSRKPGISQAAVSLTVSRERRIVLENHYEIGNSYDERPHVPIGEDQRKSFSMNAEISLTFFNCMSLVRKTFASTSMLAAIWIASMDLRKPY